MTVLTGRWKIGAAVIGLAALAVFWPRFGPAQERVIPKGKYVFLYVMEMSTHALGVPVFPAPLPRAAWNIETQGLTVARPEDKPRESTQILLIVDYEDGLVKYRPELHLLEEQRKHIPLGKPLEPAGGIPTDGIRNEYRKVRGDLELLGVDSEGTVTLEYAGEKIVLKPGTAWSEGLVSAGGRWSLLVRDGTLDQRIDSVIKNEQPLSLVYVSNQGVWELSKTTVGRVR